MEFPSGFFYINGIFYDDDRHPYAKMYSEGIMKWAQRHPEIGEPFVLVLYVKLHGYNSSFVLLSCAVVHNVTL